MDSLAPVDKPVKDRSNVAMERELYPMNSEKK